VETLRWVPHIVAAAGFIQKEFDRLDGKAPELPKVNAPIETLNQLFRNTLTEVWQP
jgi:hypothetical protein